MRLLLIVILVKNNGKISNTIHAEVNTITKYIDLYRRKGYKDIDIRRKLGKETLVVIRIAKNIDTHIENHIEHKMKNSAPCSECITFLKKYNIQKIIYSIDDGSLEFSRVKNLDNTHISRGQRAINRMRKLERCAF
jgi:uncharacterized protein YijF (DUF1287 family)